MMPTVSALPEWFVLFAMVNNSLCIVFAAEDSIQAGNSSKNCIMLSRKWEQVKLTVSDLAILIIYVGH